MIDKQRVSTAAAKYLANPLVKTLHRVGLPFPGTCILETTGRKSGEPRRTPVGKGLDGDTFWIVTEHGERASYVKNIRANPRVRVKCGRRKPASGGSRIRTCVGIANRFTAGLL